VEEVLRGQVFNRALVNLQESGFREVRRRAGVGEGNSRIGEGKKRVESQRGYRGMSRERYCNLRFVSMLNT
jgi:hypothetical protein